MLQRIKVFAAPPNEIGNATHIIVDRVESTIVEKSFKIKLGHVKHSIAFFAQQIIII